MALANAPMTERQLAPTRRFWTRVRTRYLVSHSLYLKQTCQPDLLSSHPQHKGQTLSTSSLPLIHSHIDLDFATFSAKLSFHQCISAAHLLSPSSEKMEGRQGTMRFGSTAKVLAKCKLTYYRILERKGMISWRCCPKRPTWACKK